MRKIFIDAGANNGNSVRKFRQLHDKEKQYHIYSFEVEPEFESSFSDIDNHTFINKAVWIFDGTQEFYRSKAKYIDGGTLIKSKTTGALDKGNPIVVETIDFSSWVKNNFKITDTIILKMDIEGAEYAVLGKMVNDGTIAYINELWIEWHPKKIKLSDKEHQFLVSTINIPIKKWDALGW
jgi:FkbM family methyltransferase